MELLQYRKVFKLPAFFFCMIKIKKLTEVIGKRVFTDAGDFFGEVEEANLVDNKIDGWRIRISGLMGSFLGGAKGVIIPHQFVRSIGDVIIINRTALPFEEGEETVQQVVDLSNGSN